MKILEVSIDSTGFLGTSLYINVFFDSVITNSTISLYDYCQSLKSTNVGEQLSDHCYQYIITTNSEWLGGNYYLLIDAENGDGVLSTQKIVELIKPTPDYAY